MNALGGPWLPPRDGGPRPRALPRASRAERLKRGAMAKHRRKGERSEDDERVVQSARHGTRAWRADGREARRRERAPEPGGLEWMSCHAVRLVQYASVAAGHADWPA